jgi:uncharacterized membrane protein
MGFATSIAARTRRRFRVLLAFAMPALIAALVAVFAACSSGDRSLEEVDPNAVSANPTYDQVFAIIHNRCNMCHTSDSGGEGNDAFRLTLDHSGVMAPFTTCTDIVAERFSILERVQDNTMPPGVMPRLSSEDKLLIQRWVENGAPAPCN